MLLVKYLLTLLMYRMKCIDYLKTYDVNTDKFIHVILFSMITYSN